MYWGHSGGERARSLEEGDFLDSRGRGDLWDGQKRLTRTGKPLCPQSCRSREKDYPDALIGAVRSRKAAGVRSAPCQKKRQVGTATTRESVAKGGRQEKSNKRRRQVRKGNLKSWEEGNRRRILGGEEGCLFCRAGGERATVEHIGGKCGKKTGERRCGF